MATLTGRALLDAVIDATGATVSGLFQDALALRLQAAIDAGIVSNFALASVLGANAQILATVPEGEDPLDNLIDVVAAGKQTVEDAPDEPPVVEPDFVLTADDAGGDFEGTDGDDVFVAETGSLDGTFVDGRAGDDVLNATYKAADIVGPWTPTIRNVEEINVDIDAFAGTATTFNALNVRSAAITLGSTKLGYDGDAGVTNAGGNSVIAGENVTDLTVAGLTTGSVDAGSAATVTVDSATADENTLNLTVNGDLTAVIGATTAFENVNLTSTADAEVDLTGSDIIGTVDSIFTVAGTGDVTLMAAGLILNGETIVNGLTTGELVADVATEAKDGSDWDVDKINISNGAVNTFTAPDAAVIDLEVDNTVAITGQSATTGTITVNTAVAQTSLTFATLAEAIVNVTDAVTITTLVTGGADTTVNVVDDTTITTLTGGTDDHVIAGTGDVTVTNGTAGSVNASNLTGLLDYTQAADVDTEVTGGSGNNDVTFAGTTTDSVYTGGVGDDTVVFATTTGTATADFSAGGDNTLTATAPLTTGTLAVQGGAGADEVIVAATGAATIALDLGAGNDIVDITGGIAAAATFAVDFGTGTDTLKINTDLTGVTLNMVGLDELDIVDGAGAILNGDQITGQSWFVKGNGTASTTLNVEAVAAGGTLDLSNLTFDGTIAAGIVGTEIAGGALVDNIILSSVDDEVTIVAGETGVTATTADVITGFTTAADSIAITGATAGVDFTEVDGSAYADFAAFLAAATASFGAGVLDTEFFFAYNVAGSGDGWLAFDANDNGTADNVIKLVGLAETGDIVAGDLSAVV